MLDATPTSEFERLDAQAELANCVGFSPDGLLFASGGSDAQVKIWDTKSRSMIKTLSGHSEPVSALRFSRDGTRLYSRSLEERLVWDVVSGSLLPNAEWVSGKNSSRHGNLRLRVSSGQVILVDLDWKHTERAKAYRSAKARPKRWWHRDQLQSAVDASDWYAATFHAGWLFRLDPDSPRAYYDFRNVSRRLTMMESLNLPKVIHEVFRLPPPDSIVGTDMSRKLSTAMERRPLQPMEITIADLPKLLRESRSISAFLDKRSLDELGVDTDARIKLTDRHGNLGDQLEDALRPFELSWCTTQTVLVLTSEYALKKRFADSRLYRIVTPEGETKTVIEQIAQIAPESWDRKGGIGDVVDIGSFYAIRQSPKVHRELMKALDVVSMPHQYKHPLDSRNVSLSENSKARVSDVLASISQQIDLPIEYSKRLSDFGIDLTSRRTAIDILLRDVSAKDALDLILQQHECTWVDDGQKIIVEQEDDALEAVFVKQLRGPTGPGINAKRVNEANMRFVRPGSWNVFG
ncbi:MAG: hypothetical protein AAGJ83_15835, partial [Planctomycetota bacterium]